MSLNPNGYGGADVTKAYDLIVPPTNGEKGSVSRVAATAVTTPEVMRISHQEVESAGLTIDRHLMRLDNTVTDTDLGKVTYSCYLNLIVPRGTTEITDQMILDIVGRVVDFTQNAGSLAKFLNSEP